ncbi:MAG TPA: hypothetical protein VIE14_07350 [Steroidobacteraceae bacterium]|jgi:hypothetical protein
MITELSTRERELLVAARIARDDKAGRHQRAAEALARFQQMAAEKQAHTDKLTGEEKSWIERQSRKLADYVRDGSRGPQPALAADSKILLAQASARADALAAQDALPTFEAAEAAAREDLANAESALQSAYRDCHRAHVAELIEELDGHRLAIERLRTRIAAPAYAAGVHGLRETFGGLLSAAQVERLDKVPSNLPLGQLFADHRPVVGLHDSISGAHSTSLDAHLAYWHERQQFLQDVAASGASASAQEAAA